MYNCELYDTFKDLQNSNPKLASELLENIEKGDWINYQLMVYPTYEDFALYELTDGWYIEHNLDSDYNGAPNPLDYIDLDEFGRELADRSDVSLTIVIDNVIVQTNYGW